MIQFSHVYKTYPGDIHALRNVELNIEKGEFVFMTGPSGAGKTTLFNMLSAYDKPTSGRVDVAGFELSRVKFKDVAQYRRKIGVVFQDFKLLKDRTLFDNVALPLEVKGEKSSYISKRVRDVLEQVGLWIKQDQLPEQISGGEQQRTAIARALVHQPTVLIADEPTGNLDPSLSEEIMDLFTKVNAQGTTVFIATHEHALVEKRARRRIEIKDGEITRDE